MTCKDGSQSLICTEGTKGQRPALTLFVLSSGYEKKRYWKLVYVLWQEHYCLVHLVIPKRKHSVADRWELCLGAFWEVTLMLFIFFLARLWWSFGLWTKQAEDSNWCHCSWPWMCHSKSSWDFCSGLILFPVDSQDYDDLQKTLKKSTTPIERFWTACN